MNQRSCAGAVSRMIRPLPRSCHDIRVVRGSRERISSLPPAGIANVASTATSGRVPPASSPILARTVVGRIVAPSTRTVSGASA